jgi:hypothetical protein
MAHTGWDLRSHSQNIPCDDASLACKIGKANGTEEKTLEWEENMTNIPLSSSVPANILLDDE